MLSFILCIASREDLLLLKLLVLADSDLLEMCTAPIWVLLAEISWICHFSITFDLTLNMAQMLRRFDGTSLDLNVDFMSIIMDDKRRKECISIKELLFSKVEGAHDDSTWIGPKQQNLNLAIPLLGFKWNKGIEDEVMKLLCQLDLIMPILIAAMLL